MSSAGPPRVTCKSWSVVDAGSGEVLLESGSTTPCRIASITKVMTAHVVLTLAKAQPTLLEELVLISPEAAGLAGTTAELRAGEVFSVLDLLYGMMLPSGNDAAFALAEYIGDSFAMPDAETGIAAGRRDHPATRFVAEMQRECSRLGLTATRFGNVHGMGDTRGWSNARDVAKLVAAALRQHAVLRDIARARSYTCTVRAVPDKLVRVRKWDTYAGEVAPLPDRRGYPATVVWSNLNVLLGNTVHAEVEGPTLEPLNKRRVQGATPPQPPPSKSHSLARAVCDAEDSADTGGVQGRGPGRSSENRGPLAAPSILGPSARLQLSPDTIASSASPTEFDADSGDSASSPAQPASPMAKPGSGAADSHQPSPPSLRRRVTYVYDGVKTGRTPAAGACLCSSLRLVSVTHHQQDVSAVHSSSPAGVAMTSHATTGPTVAGVAPATHLPLPHLLITVLGSTCDAARFRDTEALAAYAVRHLHLADLSAMPPEKLFRLVPGVARSAVTGSAMQSSGYR